MTNADLRGVTFEGAAIANVGSWKGAKVNWHTCWPKGFELDKHKPALIAVKLRPSSATPSHGESCAERDARRQKQRDKEKARQQLQQLRELQAATAPVATSDGAEAGRGSVQVQGSAGSGSEQP